MARAHVVMPEHVRLRLEAGTLPKGDVMATARIAGIMAAKRTPDIVPLCHPLPLTMVEVDADARRRRRHDHRGGRDHRPDRASRWRR